jgi:hypothetical protein
VVAALAKQRDSLVEAELDARRKNYSSFITACEQFGNGGIFPGSSANLISAKAKIDVISMMTNAELNRIVSDGRTMLEWVHTTFIGPPDTSAMTIPNKTSRLPVASTSCPSTGVGACASVDPTPVAKVSALESEREATAQWAVDASLRVDELRASVTAALGVLEDDLLRICDAAQREVHHHVVRLRFLCRSFVLYLDSLCVKTSLLTIQRGSDSLWSSQHSVIFERLCVSRIARLLQELNADVEVQREKASRWVNELNTAAQSARQQFRNASLQKEAHIRRCEDMQEVLRRLLRSKWEAVLAPSQNSLRLYESQLASALRGAKEQLMSEFRGFIRALSSEAEGLMHLRSSERRQEVSGSYISFVIHQL